ncbi:heme utilization protein [Pseudomonas aeruginosa]|nr:heme utilization protein [Pseudomonas aeruginosa]
METKDAPDLLREGRDLGAMLKYGYHSNDQQKIYSGAVFGRSEDRRVDALLYLNGRDGRDMKLADNLPLSPTDYPINPKRLPNSAQDEKTGLFKLNLHPTRGARPGFHLPALEKLALDAVLRQQLPDPAEPVDHRPLRLRAGPDPPAGPPRYHRHHLDRQVQLPSAGQSLDRPATELFRRPHRAARPSARTPPSTSSPPAASGCVPSTRTRSGTAQHQPFRYRSATARADPGRGAAQAPSATSSCTCGQDL